VLVSFEGQGRERDQVDSAADKCLLCQPLDKANCIFCGEQDVHLHEFRTFDADDNVRTKATSARDSTGDLTVLGAKNQLTCLTSLRNRYHYLLRQRQSSHSKLEEPDRWKSIVELVTNVENAVADGNSAPDV
jgi:hypothetical protein